MTTAPTPETLRLVGVIADKIEDGTLFRAGIYKNKELAEKVRAVLQELQRLESERITRIDQQTKLSLRIVDLQAENERLRAAVEEWLNRTEWVQKTILPEELGAHRADILRDRIKKLERQLVNALVGDRLTAQKVEAICAREPYAVTGVVLSMPDGRACIVNQSAVRWFHGERDFWSVMHPDSNPQPISYRCRIGLPCSKCQTGKYRAAGNGYYDFHRCDSCMHVPMWGADGNELGPAPLIASREVVADGPVRVTRLHLSTEGRAALTTKATGPLPGITGGQS